MLRRAIEEPTQRATFAAVFSIFAFLDVPIVFFSIKWWRTQHPQPVIMGGEGSGLDPKMATTLWVCSAAFLLLFTAMFRRRVAVEYMRAEVNALREGAEGA